MSCPSKLRYDNSPLFLYIFIHNCGGSTPNSSLLLSLSLSFSLSFSYYIMEGIRKALRKMPPSTTIKVLRKVFAMPAPAARLILNDVTRARKEHKPWIKKVTWNLEWKGCWIGEDISGLDEGSIRQKIDEADVVFFNVHGGGFRLGTPTMYMDAYISWIKTLKLKYGLNAIMMSADYR